MTRQINSYYPPGFGQSSDDRGPTKLLAGQSMNEDYRWVALATLFVGTGVSVNVAEVYSSYCCLTRCKARQCYVSTKSGDRYIYILLKIIIRGK